ncbi:hypothetical protein CPG38_13695 [Malaciobacter marinus]|uniref:hypothetical protein n=1 Tax=Malaciobacter marinus TaxID=505249 RepID=UPI000C0892BA|nr:hypothetical protein [Malaciobacter marinus]PHO11322.1 hypothetical protein CPG38_13695 [Malaciobacter marinus]
MSWKTFAHAYHYSGSANKGKASAYGDYLMRDNECEAVYKNNQVYTEKEQFKELRSQSKKEWSNHLEKEKNDNARLQTRIIIPIPNNMTKEAKQDLANNLSHTITHKKSNSYLDDLKEKVKDNKREADKLNKQIKRAKGNPEKEVFNQEREAQKKLLQSENRKLTKQIKDIEKDIDKRNEKRDILHEIVEHKGDKKSKNPNEQNRHFHIVLSDRDKTTGQKDREFQDKDFLKDIKQTYQKTLEKHGYQVKENPKEFQRQRLSQNDYKEYKKEENKIVNEYHENRKEVNKLEKVVKVENTRKEQQSKELQPQEQTNNTQINKQEEKLTDRVRNSTSSFNNRMSEMKKKISEAKENSKQNNQSNKHESIPDTSHLEERKPKEIKPKIQERK